MKLRQTSTEMPRSKVRNGLIAVVLFVVAAGIYSYPTPYNEASDFLNTKVGLSLGHLNPEPFRLGLDLRGGASLMYDVDVKNVAAGDEPAAVEGARDVIERRVNAFGVSEPLVQTTKSSGVWRILVDLPDVHNVQQAIDMIGATPTLEFRDKQGGNVQLTDDQKKAIADANVAAKTSADVITASLKTAATFDDVYAKNGGKDLGAVTKADSATIYNWAAKTREGTFTRTPLEDAQGYYFLQRGATSAHDFVSARHILLCWKGATGCTGTMTKDEALQKAKDLLLKLTPQNFGDLAKVNSTEPGADKSGGDLGEFDKGKMVKAFEDAVFPMKVGEIKGPIETEFGYHIIYKYNARTEPAYGVRGFSIAKKTEADAFANTSEWKPTGLSGKQLSRATLEFSPQTGQPTVSLEFNAEGQQLFADITKRDVNQQVAIFLDGQPISTPTVNEPILDGKAIISGSFTLAEAQQMVERLNAGALPLPIKLSSQQTVGATLGADSLKQSAKAGAIGFALVVLFLIAFYRLPGLLASVALIAYTAIVLAVFKFIPVTLTLAGIAGFILSLGMAVDANVLVFERTREELARGLSPLRALEEAFPRAWNSIRDSNASSLITCVILYWFGSSIVQGFALNLAIGILASLFSAITVTRLLLRFTAPWFAKHPALFIQSVPQDKE